MKDIGKKSTFMHAAGWALTYLFFLWVFMDVKTASPFRLAAAALLASALVFYSHLFLLTRYWNSQKYRFYALSLCVLLLLSPFFFMLAFGVAAEEWAHLPVSYLPFLLLSLIFILLSWIVKAAENRFTHALKRERLEKQAVQAELSYLKAQINPHFLFNTLNNIHALVYMQAASAPDAVRSLSSLMRYMIYESNTNTVPLEREVDYLLDYVRLQQLRYENTPVAAINIVGDLSSRGIAPLLLIHLLENAYKHSPARLNVEDIKVRIEVSEDRLHFNTENPIRRHSSNTLQEPGGMGLENIKKRLQLLYPGQHTFATTSTESVFRAQLTIPCIHVKDA